MISKIKRIAKLGRIPFASVIIKTIVNNWTLKTIGHVAPAKHNFDVFLSR